MANLSNLPKFATYFLEQRFSGKTVAIFSVALAVFLPFMKRPEWRKPKGWSTVVIFSS
jgi:hypothetical protein